MPDYPVPNDPRANGPPERGRYDQPHWMTPAGQQDRRLEGMHQAFAREIERKVERTRLEIAMQLDKEVTQLSADARLLSEQKYAIDRAQRESQLLAGDDVERQAKFAILDDDWFHQIRVRKFRGQP